MSSLTKVEDLAIGEAVWVKSAIAVVIGESKGKKHLKKITAPISSMAQFSLSIYASGYDDLRNRCRLATRGEVDAYIAKHELETEQARARFLAGFGLTK
jgi:hypothetical protein